MTSEATGLTTRAEAQDTFVALLTTPFVSARVASARFAAVLQHRAQLTEWTGRLAYRLVIAGSVARLHRDPAGPQRTAAPAMGAPPSRRALTLVALTAAACEDADMTTTVQALSDEVRAISAGPGARVMPYNPDRRTERQAFLRGVNQLAGLGILLRRTTDEALLRQWEEDGTGVGAGFEVDRDALLQFTDPHTVALALRQPEVDDDHELISLELDDVVGLLAALDIASEHLPSDSDVVTAVLAARDAAKRVMELQAEAGDDGKIAEAAQSAADVSAASVAGHCDEHDLPRTRPEVAGVLTALSDYVSAIIVLEGKMSLVGPLSTAAEQAEEALDGLVAAAGTAAADAAEDRGTASRLRSQADAAGKALSKDAQEILREVSRLSKRIKDAGDVLKQLDASLLELVTQLARAQTVLEDTEGKRKSAEADREAAANRWWACVDSGLPRLRGVPDSPSRNVTAALENYRAARAMISPRNWPDSDQQHQFAQVVQNRWAAMVSDSSDLRSKLELLGGRSVQVISPGDGREDFPGSLQLIVDSTGTALAPPKAADRLSALLEQLQADYDDELTKTIDELLGSTFIEHLRDRLSEAETLRDDINKKLAQNPTAISGITLRLRRIPVTEERAANDVLDTLEQHFDMLPKPSQDRIRVFLSERITSAQEAARASGDPNWRSRLAEILDYRRWFELHLEYRTPRSESGDRPGGGWRSLERGDHGLLSGGAKVVTLMQPFIAALHGMYDQSGSGPRMLWLDEAFGGVDGTNKASMFRLLTSCDLDWLVAGPGIIANSAAVPMAAIYEVRRAPQPLPGVSLELAVWAGNELTHVMAPDPADLKDMTASDNVDEDNDALF